MSRTAIFLVLLLSLTARSAAAACSGASPTWTAASTSHADVNACVTVANNDDTIHIPAGSSVWTSKITLTTKSLSFIGAGPDATIITDNVTGGGILQLQSTIGTARVSNFQVTGILDGFNGTIRVQQNNARVDNMKFTLSNGRHAVRVFGQLTNVVVDHNDFGNNSRGVNINGSTAYWTTPAAYAPGTLDCIYIEDNIFRARNVEIADLTFGGCYVFRYNELVDGGNIAMHGADSGDRSGGFAEIYENTFTNPGGAVAFAMIFRGGNQIIFNNTITGPYTSIMSLNNWRSCYTENAAAGQPFDVENRNNCEHNSVNPLDGDEDPPANGWPCKDQIGRGPNQGSYPSYEWGNLYNGSDADFGVRNLGDCTSPSTLDHIISGRDFFNDTVMPGYTALVYPHPLVSGEEPPEEEPVSAGRLRGKIKSRGRVKVY